MNNYQGLGRSIKEARKRVGMTQAEVSLIMKKSPTAIGHWEAGRTCPTLVDATLLVELMGPELAVQWFGLQRLELTVTTEKIYAGISPVSRGRYKQLEPKGDDTVKKPLNDVALERNQHHAQEMLERERRATQNDGHDAMREFQEMRYVREYQESFE